MNQDEIKLGAKALTILRHLAKCNRNNAETTRFYYNDRKPLAKLREYELIEPSRFPSDGSMVTDKGREYLESIAS